MNRKMTLFARGAKWGMRGASGREGSLCARRPSCFSSDASASMPKPPPARERNSRREDDRSTDPQPQSMSSLQIDERVQVEHRAAELRERRLRQKVARQGEFALRGTARERDAVKQRDLL